jgi:hypothetical protein
MRRQVAHQAAGFVVTDVLPEKVLTVEIGVLNDVKIKDTEMSDTFAAEPLPDLTANPASADEDTGGLREPRLVKSSDQFLSVSDRKAWIGRR